MDLYTTTFQRTKSYMYVIWQTSKIKSMTLKQYPNQQTIPQSTKNTLDQNECQHRIPQYQTQRGTFSFWLTPQQEINKPPSIIQYILTLNNFNFDCRHFIQKDAPYALLQVLHMQLSTWTNLKTRTSTREFRMTDFLHKIHWWFIYYILRLRGKTA